MSKLTKEVKIDDVALPIIGAMDWREEGASVVGTLTCGQLDRPTYLAVNKGLDALGGKWNRKLAGHVFSTDPRPQIQELLESGIVEVERDGYFVTPREIGVMMAEMAELEPGLFVLEPSAGTGDLVRAILEVEPGIQVTCIEKNAQRAQVVQSQGHSCACGDFLSMDVEAERIIQNPPFELLQDIDHVRHAYECLLPGGRLVSVMSESPFFRSDHKAVDFRTWLETLNHEVIELEADAFRESGTGVKTRIVKVRRG